VRKYNGLQRMMLWVQGREDQVPVQAEYQWKFVLNQVWWIFRMWVLTISPSPPKFRKHRPENNARKAYFANSCNNRSEFHWYSVHVSFRICIWLYYQHTALTVWRKTKPFSKRVYLKISRYTKPNKYWLQPQSIEYLMFIGPCIIVITEE